MENHLTSVYVIIGLWIVLFIAGQFTGLEHALCGVGIKHLQWQFYRYITATFLHVSWIHLLANCLALYFITLYLDGKISNTMLTTIGILGATLTNIAFSVVFKDAEYFCGGSVLVFSIIGFILSMQLMCKNCAPFRLGTWYGNWTVAYAVLSNFVNGDMRFFDLSSIVCHGMSFTAGFLLGIVLFSLQIFGI